MFIEKLNKSPSGVYQLEEELIIDAGKWEGALEHDNVDHNSITIYTGPKLTGEKVDNYFISTPSKTPWRTEIKVFSDKPKVYIAYESTGDQVDADDINLLQDSLEIDILNLAEYKISNDSVIGSLKDRATNLEGVKADKTYVDTELNKKYNKDQVFTKEEVLQKVKDLIGTAPEALDTLGKLADALDNDPNFATNIINLLAGKVDSVEGKSLTDENYTLVEKSKLAGMEAEANNYNHPATHSANIIVENTGKRFITDLEKNEIAKVKDKADKAYVDSKVKTDVPLNAKFTDTIYTHPSGANPHGISKADVGLEKVDNIQQATKSEFNSHDIDSTKHITGTERNRWNTKADVSQIPTKNSQLANDSDYVTQSDLGSAGLGDMLKSTYDTNNNGKVDDSDKLGGKLPNQYMRVGPLNWNDLKGV